MVKIRLEKEEQAALISVEAGEWLPVDDLEARKKEYRDIARATFRKDSRAIGRFVEKQS